MRTSMPSILMSGRCSAIALAIDPSPVPTSSTSALIGISFARFAARIRTRRPKTSAPWALFKMSFPAIMAFGQRHTLQWLDIGPQPCRSVNWGPPSYLNLNNCGKECRKGELQRQSDACNRHRQYSDHRTVLKRPKPRIHPLRDTPDHAAETEHANEQRNEQHSLQCERNKEPLHDLRTWQ